MSHINLRQKIFLRHHYQPFISLLQPKFIHSHTFPNPTSTKLDLSNPTFMIYGANTGVGKTLVSAGISASILSSPNPSHCLYIKPVQTGFPSDSDSRFLFRKIPDIFRAKKQFGLLASNRVLNASREVFSALSKLPEETLVVKGEEEGFWELNCVTLYGWREAVSAHLAAEREGMGVDDEVLREELGNWLSEGDEKGGIWRLVETAGGVASPGPSGSLQCDLYRQVVFLKIGLLVYMELGFF